MKTVITYGTFDLFHVGHVRILKRLRALGDRLIVGISSDEFNAIKGKKSFFSYAERAEIVSSCQYVDEVFPEHNWEQKRADILKYQADIFGMGHDWQGKFDDLSDICQVVYLERTEDISTTEIKRSLSLITPEQLHELEHSVHSMVEVMNVILKSTNR
ncbi:adenylyltransferase/cytidyltransferase family protein [Lonepinella sp. BR2930]|uniref:adenylyltransferase/cytidyltransferase family protein n=1 Tax=Lonepinella sp. BR2930 TaxID=3434554 RepID=UPI003F6DD6FF